MAKIPVNVRIEPALFEQLKQRGTDLGLSAHQYAGKLVTDSLEFGNPAEVRAELTELREDLDSLQEEVASLREQLRSVKNPRRSAKKATRNGPDLGEFFSTYMDSPE